MQEYRAAAAGDARGSVVIDLDDEIVEVVVAPEPVAAAIAVEPNRLIIMAVPRVFPPGVLRPEVPNREMAGRCWGSLPWPPHAPRPDNSLPAPSPALALLRPFSPP